VTYINGAVAIVEIQRKRIKTTFNLAYRAKKIRGNIVETASLVKAIFVRTMGHPYEEQTADEVTEQSPCHYPSHILLP